MAPLQDIEEPSPQRRKAFLANCLPDQLWKFSDLDQEQIQKWIATWASSAGIDLVPVPKHLAAILLEAFDGGADVECPNCTAALSFRVRLSQMWLLPKGEIDD